jgi:NADH dehydrogenase FAD-containing subunit
VAVAANKPFFQVKMQDNRRVLIIGASMAGITVWNRLKDQGLELTIVEKQQSLFLSYTASRCLVDPEFAKDSFADLRSIPGLISDTVVKLSDKEALLESGKTISFDFVVIASGSQYGLPFKLQNQIKEDSMKVLSETHQMLRNAQNVVLLGGGSVACELACDIKSRFPNKNLTILVRSHDILLSPDGVVLPSTRLRIKKRLESLHIAIIYGAEFNMKDNVRSGRHQIVISAGHTIHSDLTIKCYASGKANTSFVDFELESNGEIRVSDTLQVIGTTTAFSLGDACNAAQSKSILHIYEQADIVAYNLLSLILNRPLKSYISKVTTFSCPLGRGYSVTQAPYIPAFLSDFGGIIIKSQELMRGKMLILFNNGTMLQKAALSIHWILDCVFLYLSYIFGK